MQKNRKTSSKIFSIKISDLQLNPKSQPCAHTDANAVYTDSIAALYRTRYLLILNVICLKMSLPLSFYADC